MAHTLRPSSCSRYSRVSIITPSTERKETFWSLLLACEPTLGTYLTHYSLTATVKLITFAKRASFFSLLDSINSNLISRSHKSYRAGAPSKFERWVLLARAPWDTHYSSSIDGCSFALSRSLPKELNWIFNFTPNSNSTGLWPRLCFCALKCALFRPS